MQHVDKNMTMYSIYVKNQYYYDKDKNKSTDMKQIEDFCNAVADSIPELKNVSQGQTGIILLPGDSLSSNTDTFDKSQLIGVLSSNLHDVCDIEMRGGTLYTENDKSVSRYNLAEVRAMKEKIAATYTSLGNPEEIRYVTEELQSLEIIEKYNGVMRTGDGWRPLHAERSLPSYATQSAEQSTESVLKKLLQTKYDTVLNMKDGTTDKSVDSKA